MSTNKRVKGSALSCAHAPLSIKELGVLLVKNYELNEGLFELVIEYKIGTGTFGPDSESVVPGAMVGVSKIGLAQVQVKGPLTIDASLENPIKKIEKRVKKKILKK